MHRKSKSKLQPKDELQIGVRTRPNSLGSSISSNSEDERQRQAHAKRDCLAEAIKRNMVAIVATMPFQESENADIVVPDCVNEEECAKIRVIADRRDQVRALMGLVTKRSFSAMSKVMDIIQRQSPDLHSKIMGIFQELLEEGTERDPNLCTTCRIQNSVNIKDICDHFYEKSLMSKELFNELPYSKLKVGTQSMLWDSFFEHNKNTSPKLVMDTMISALSDTGTYHEDIVSLLKRDIARRRHFKCRCQNITVPQLLAKQEDPSCRQSYVSSETSESECSSCSQLSINHAGPTEIKGKSASRTNINRLKCQQEINETKSKKKSVSHVNEEKDDKNDIKNKDLTPLLNKEENQSCRSSSSTSLETLQSNSSVEENSWINQQKKSSSKKRTSVYSPVHSDRYGHLEIIDIRSIDSAEGSLSRQDNRFGSCLRRLFSGCCVCTTFEQKHNINFENNSN